MSPVLAPEDPALTLQTLSTRGSLLFQLYILPKLPSKTSPGQFSSLGLLESWETHRIAFQHRQFSENPCLTQIRLRPQGACCASNSRRFLLLLPVRCCADGAEGGSHHTQTCPPTYPLFLEFLNSIFLYTQEIVG